VVKEKEKKEGSVMVQGETMKRGEKEKKRNHN
jgi:hypothetical protein